MSREPIIREATGTDAAQLADFAARTFTDTFAATCSAENLAACVAQQCSPFYFESSLQAGDTVLMQLLDDTLIGYGKCGRVTLPVATPVAGAQEIHRLYIDKPFHGQRHGHQLLQYMLQLPRMKNAPALYLGVWEHNEKAKALYAKYGFETVQSYIYMVGNQADTDLIMRRKH